MVYDVNTECINDVYEYESMIYECVYMMYQ